MHVRTYAHTKSHLYLYTNEQVKHTDNRTYTRKRAHAFKHVSKAPT